jgi:hypothetical protein
MKTTGGLTSRRSPKTLRSLTLPARQDKIQLVMHSIRLRGSWTITSLASATQHQRKFGRPRTLDANERLWLVCNHIPGSAEVAVNGEVVATVAAPGPVAADITSLLQPRNTVVFTVSSADPLGEVLLEVRFAV